MISNEKLTDTAIDAAKQLLLPWYETSRVPCAEIN
jgi:hypothetical protein